MSITPDYRDQFIRILNNRDGSRERGFLVFLHGAVDLAPLEEVCFSPDQTYNRCITVRYGAGKGDVLTPLLSSFVEDAKVIRRRTFESGMARSSTTGSFRPPPPDQRWNELLDVIGGMGGTDGEFAVENVFSMVEKILQTGERLVFFCELIDVPAEATLQDLGFDDEMVARVLTRLPKRMGLVFSGLPEHMRVIDRPEIYLDLTAGPDYAVTGIAPSHSLPLKNDSPRGEDRLGILSEVHALADSIASRDLEPPLVVGIIGGWGSGKSFILQLLQQRLRFIRNMDLSNGEVQKNWAYVGHPYLIRFDAWTYAKSDLWASLMERILYDLDQQLDLERTLASQLVKGFDLWEILNCSTDAELQQLSGALGEEAIARIQDWKKGAATAMALWDVLRALRSRELEELGEANKALDDKKRENEAALRAAQIQMEQDMLKARQEAEDTILSSRQAHQNTLAQKQALYDATRAAIDASVDKAIEKIARKEAWTPVRQEVVSFFGDAVDGVLKEVGAKSDGSPISIWMVEKEISQVRKYAAGLKRSPASLAFLVVAVLSVLVAWYFSRVQLASFFPQFTGVVGFVGGALASGYTALAKVNRWFEEKQSAYEEKMNAARTDKAALREKMLAERKIQLVPLETQIRTLREQFEADIKFQEAREQEKIKQLRIGREKELEELKKKHEEEIQKLNAQVEEHKRRAGIPGQCESLAELIQKRLESGYYQKRLGILHQVQKDLGEISDALLTHDVQSAEKLFPRGQPRIILMIDDLDRCPPRQVVQVLEAAQLLVKTRLFVVVIAMDVRYVTRALEKEYEGILRHDGHPSGLDYTEKIVQIPYRVRPIAPEAMRSYLRSQVEVRAQGEQPAPGPAPVSSLPPATITEPGQASLRVNEALPPEIQMFEPQEMELLEAAAVSVEINPRATKRLVNVMKIIKSIWYRRGSEQPSLQVKQAMILLLTLSASYPETMARILDELERSYRDGRVIHGIAAGKLLDALQVIIQRWCSQEGSAEDWETVTSLIANGALLDPALSLGEFSLANLQIVRSFSFLGEVDMPVVGKPQRHSVELSGPGTISPP